MRSAEFAFTGPTFAAPATRARRGATLLALAVGALLISGCGMVPQNLMGMGRGDAGDNTAGPSATAAARKPPVRLGPPIDPLVQQSFDAAIRAQREGRDTDAERGWRALIAAHPELGGPHANLGLLRLRADKPPRPSPSWKLRCA